MDREKEREIDCVVKCYNFGDWYVMCDGYGIGMYGLMTTSHIVGVFWQWNLYFFLGGQLMYYE